MAEPIPRAEADSSAPRNYFDPTQFETETCGAYRGMWQWGTWGFAALPWPAYRDLRGWDIGLRGAISAEADRPAGAIATLFVSVGINSREERAFGIGELSPVWRAGAGWTIRPSLHGFALPERTGVGTSLRTEHIGEVEGETFTVELRLMREEFKALRHLGPTEWEPGRNSWAGFNVKYRFRTRLFPGTIEARTSIYSGGRAWGGDFAYKRFMSSLSWSLARVTLWATGGTASGNLPAQLRFDLGDHGQMHAVPLWKVRSRGFAALGFDAGARVFRGFLAGAYSTTSNFPAETARQWEVGLSAILCYDGDNPRLSEWFLRVDWPVYCSIAEAISAREKWDLRRIMIRIDLPIQGVEGPDTTRYRYPNR